MDIIGTPNNDILTGTTGDDVIEGLDGDDIISGDLGADIIRGGDGRDNLNGDLGDDLIEGGAGNDFLKDGSGDDEVDGGDGDDYILNDDGSDMLRGGAGADSIVLLRSPGQSDHVTALGGDDADNIQIASSGSSSFEIDGGAGSDRIEFFFFKGHADLALGAGADIVSLTQSFGPSVGIGSITISDFETGAAGDRLQMLDFIARSFTNWNHALSPFTTGHVRLFQDGADTLLEVDLDGGGDGFVTIIRFTGETVAAFTAENLSGYNSDGTIPAGQNITGTVAADELGGLAGDDQIDGLDGRDIIRGGAGNDALSGGEGQDDLYGEIGDDNLSGGAGNDIIDGGYGADIMSGGDGDDYLDSRRGADTVDGGAGNDSFFLERGSLTVEAVTASGGDDDDTMSVYSYGGSTFDLDGGAGDDLIVFGTLAGAATIALGDGADRIVLGGTQPSNLLNTGSVTISDFAAGAGGDTIDLDPFLVAILVNWDGSSNPFGTGHLRLVQSGADTLLQVDQFGNGNAYRTIVTFQGTVLADLTADNFNGLPPDGSAPPGQTIIGTPLSDELEGGGGDDHIDGLAEQDIIHAGAGADLVIGGDGDDLLYGEAGADRLEGGEGPDFLDGGTGADLLYGGAGDDLFLDNAGSDQIFGGDGADTIIVQRFDGQPDFVTVDGGAGDDDISLNSYGQNYEVDAGEGDDLVSTLALYGNVRIALGAGADTLDLRETDVRSVYGLVTVEDFATGAAGDRVDLNDFFGAALTAWDEVANPFTTGDARLVQSGADTLFQIDRSGGGDSFETVIRFLDVGASTFTAENFGYAIPAVYGSEGNDLYTVDDAGDVIVELAGGGIDEVRTSLGSKAPPDRAVYVLPDFVENLTGISAGAQGVRGNALDNVINMGVGHDLIVLDDGGVDTVNGGGGNDFIYYGDTLTAADITNGGAGVDTVGLLGNYAAGLVFTATNLVGVERMAFYTGGGTNSYNFTMHDANVAAGTEFFVTAASLNAIETLTFNGSAETNGRFTIHGGGGGDTITGGAGGDFIIGNAGNDALYGLGGMDFLIGGLGADQLRGGAGADRFVYQSTAQSATGSIDHILDFQHVDRIDLSGIDANGNAGDGNSTFAFIGSNAFGNVAGQLRAYQSGADWFVEGDTNGDGLADLVIQVTLPDATPLGVGDFIL